MEEIIQQKLLIDNQGWDEYWSKKNNGGIVYALIAEFYRKVIIRPNLNYFIRKCFPANAKLLHAGCGSGQVDVDITPKYHVTGLDISQKALKIYSESNQGRCETLHGSIFDIRMPERSMDGIYNLGVMEHFSEEEIARILVQFHRVLKDNGKLLLFWPPEFGVSVLFFKFLRGTIKLLTRRDVKFHPDEISRIKSKKSVQSLLNASGFKMLQYSFGPRDVWTYSILVAEKA